MSTMINPKPCPWCKGTDIETQIGTPDREGTPVNAICTDCGATGPWKYAPTAATPEMRDFIALSEWNTRRS